MCDGAETVGEGEGGAVDGFEGLVVGWYCGVVVVGGGGGGVFGWWWRIGVGVGVGACAGDRDDRGGWTGW